MQSLPLLNLPIHHIGVATKSLESEKHIFQSLGFTQEGSFSDERQGVRGVFMTLHPCKSSLAFQWRFELLENLEGSKRLDNYLKTHNKLYHIAFETHNIELDMQSILNYDFSSHNALDSRTHSIESYEKTANSNAGGGYMQINNTLPKAMQKPIAYGKSRLLIPPMEAEYFAKLCFIMLPNRLLIELVEPKDK